MHIKAPCPGRFYLVFDAETGAEYENVLEANSDEGWLILAVSDENGIILDGNEVRTERIERPIRIEETDHPVFYS